MPATVGGKRYQPPMGDPRWSLTRWGYFTGGGRWKDSAALYDDLDYRFLWETDIDLTPGQFLVRSVGFREAFVLDVNDAIAFAGISKPDIRSDVSQCLGNACIAATDGYQLSILTHTSGWTDVTVGLVLCEQSTIGRPADMRLRGPSQPALSKLDLVTAIFKER